MSKKNSKEAMQNLQNDENYVILNNPLASPKFVRAIAKGQKKKDDIKLRQNAIANDDIYTPKIFYEILSKLNPEHLEGIKRTETIKFDIQIKPFLQEIGANVKNYKHLVDSVDALIGTTLKWKEGDKTITTPIISKSIHNEKTGRIELYVDSDLAKHILQLKDKENFSFLKSNIFRLQNAQAIRLYPFFKKWLGLGQYSTDLERFKVDFGYNTSGYRFFTNLEKKVLQPAIEEINEKTDLTVGYEVTGENLSGKRPRIKGLIFVIKAKDKPKRIEIAAAEPPKEKRQTYDLAQLYALFTSLKVEPTARLPKATAEAALMQWVDKNGYEAVYNGLMRAKDTYNGEIKNPIGFFNGSYFADNKNYLQQKQEAEQRQVKKQQEAIKLQTILNDFKQRETAYFIRLYGQQPQEIKQLYIEEIRTNQLYFHNNMITELGEAFVGQKIAENTAYNPIRTLQNMAQRDYQTILGFNAQGKPFIKGEFPNQTDLFDASQQD